MPLVGYVHQTVDMVCVRHKSCDRDNLMPDTLHHWAIVIVTVSVHRPCEGTWIVQHDTVL